MRALDAARETCEAFLPGLQDQLAALELDELEGPESSAIALFRAAGGPGLVIPRAYAGAGADPLQAMAVTRALASRAPSLAVATTMHHFSVATLFTLAESVKSSGMEWALLEGVATQRLLVASGFAEGKPGQGILTPTMSAVKAEGGYLINGSKKPCSLSRSFDLLTASVSVTGDDGQQEMAVLLLPRQSEGITVHPFWSSWALAGAESDEIRLTDVFADEQLLMRTDAARDELDDLQTIGFIWFELLISSSYLGMASALVERVFAAAKGSESDRAAVVLRLESATLLLEGMARMIMAGEVDDVALGKTLVARYAAQDALTDTVNRAVELLGGMAFISSPEVAYLAAVTHALAFHPPSRGSFTVPFLAHVGGQPLRLGSGS
ncbi:acyl-CoA dehydrogenase family protein [Lentzea sp. NPDC042327]|uniref:acyl-CoA dehydrogenase family protein n=1 Tax=Lentzea sp. NPDC042327 TaxID=3154801 RepID=UPI0033FD5876